MTPEGIAAAEAIVKENRRVTVNEIAAHLDMSHGSAHRIVHEVTVYLLCLITCGIKNISGFHLTHPRITSHRIYCITQRRPNKIQSNNFIQL